MEETKIVKSNLISIIHSALFVAKRFNSSLILIVLV